MDEAMEALRSDLKALPKLAFTVVVLVSYSRYASSLLKPGLPRFLSLLPVVSLLPFLPFTFSTIYFRGFTGFFLTWLCSFKLLLLSFGKGPLDSSLPLTCFTAISILPVKLQDDPKSKQLTTFSWELVISTAIRGVLLATLFPIYSFKEKLNYYAFLLVRCVHMYLALELILSTCAMTSQAFGMKLEPQFNKPYFTTSLRDFWGRRWNLMVSSILRSSIFEPVRIYCGPIVGVLAAFLTSGLMHELLFYYDTLRKPTGEVTAFFMLHGICVVIEWWWVKHQMWWCLPRLVATPLTLGFIIGTAQWLFFPPLFRTGVLETVHAEEAAMIAMIKDLGRCLIQWQSR